MKLISPFSVTVPAVTRFLYWALAWSRGSTGTKRPLSRMINSCHVVSTVITLDLHRVIYHSAAVPCIALAMYVIVKGGDNLDMGGEKHGAEAVQAPAK